FPFERDVDNVREAAREMRVEYPIALDSDYGVWRAFDNHYWPAVYIADDGGLVSVVDEGFEAQADWENLGSPETYLGYEQAQNFAGDAAYGRPYEYVVPEPLNLNEWALGGSWTIGPGHSTANEPGGRLAFRFHARDVNL